MVGCIFPVTGYKLGKSQRNGTHLRYVSRYKECKGVTHGQLYSVSTVPLQCVTDGQPTLAGKYLF